MARRRHRDARMRDRTGDASSTGRDAAQPAAAPASAGPEAVHGSVLPPSASTPRAPDPKDPRARTLIDLPPARGIPREDVAPLLSAHLAPIAAMLFLGQTGREILLLFALDTALTICVLVWLVIEHITEAKSGTTGVRRALSHAAGALVVGAFFSLMLVAPIAFIAIADGAHLDALLASKGFQAAFAMQLAGSAWSLVRMHRELSAREDDDAYLSTRFKFVVARWVIVLFVAFSGIPSMFGPRFAAIVLVIVYCGAGIWFGLFPERAHRLFHPQKSKGPGP